MKVRPQEVAIGVVNWFVIGSCVMKRNKNVQNWIRYKWKYFQYYIWTSLIRLEKKMYVKVDEVEHWLLEANWIKSVMY